MTSRVDPGTLYTIVVTKTDGSDTTSRAAGAYLKARRVAAGLSLREIAAAIGVSHVFLGEFERGVRQTIKKERWVKLEESIPGFSVREFERLLLNNRPLRISLEDAPAEYQDLGLALARRIDRKDLKQSEIDNLLRILRGGDEEDE